MRKATHTAEVLGIHERILQASPAEGRTITIDGGYKIHLLEAGNGPPVVFFHGGGAAAHTALPFVERSHGVHYFVPDRPGYGLSDSIPVGQEGYRAMAIRVTDEILNALGLDEVFLAGSSGGSVWAIWYALAHPERVRRLLLLGSAPLLPGTHAPLPMRLSVAPVIGAILARLPSDEDVAAAVCDAIPDCQLVVLPAGHVPYLGNPDKVAGLLMDFVGAN